MTTISGQNDLSNTQNLMKAVVYDYKGLRVIAYHGRTHQTGSKMIHGPVTKNDDVAPRQVLDTDLFLQFLLILKAF